MTAEEYSNRIEGHETNTHTKQEKFLFTMIFVFASLCMAREFDRCLCTLQPKFAAMPELWHIAYQTALFFAGWITATGAVAQFKRFLPRILTAETTGYCKTKNILYLCVGGMTLAITAIVLTLCIMKISGI